MKKRTAAIILGTLFLLTLVFSNPTSSFGSGPPWYTGWAYRKSHTINPAGGAGTNYQVPIHVHYGSGMDDGKDVYLNGKCQADFDDIRFTDNDGTTLLDYWMETKVNSNYAIFWVEVRDNLSTNAQTIYIYYGNDDATTTSNGANTFLLFDNFDDGTINTNIWTEVEENPSYATVAESGGYLVLTAKTSGSGSYKHAYIYSSLMASGRAAGFRYKRTKDGAFMGSTNEFIGFANGKMFDAANNEIVGYNWYGSSPPYEDEYSYRNEKAGTVQTTHDSGIAQNTWYNFEYCWSLTNITHLRNGVVKRTTTDTNYIPTVNLRLYFTIAKGANVGAMHLNIDWTYIRKFVATEPSHGGWGSQEGDEATVVFRSTGGLWWFEQSGWPDEGAVSYAVSYYIWALFDSPPYNYRYYGNGPDVTKDNILSKIEDCNYDRDYATFFIFANGGNYTDYDVVWYVVPPAIPYQVIPVTHYRFYDTPGDTISDQEIGEITYGGSTLHFVFLWSCVQANEIGSFHNSYWIYEPYWYYQGSGAAGMPYAWTGRDYTQMSPDGYDDPDTGSYCFIGFEGLAMPMSEEIPDSGDKNYGDFAATFYLYALVYGYSIKQALDGASQDVFGVEHFNQTPLYNGYEKYLPDPFNETWPGKMRVYGNGNNYLPN